ncbi:MAG TPA: DUF2946 family protein, partial [Gemmatimonadales bacterium]|nr:DUF2946 family protein [Gemmatimonadales bacterium]
PAVLLFDMVTLVAPLLRRSVVALALAQVAVCALTPVHAEAREETRTHSALERVHHHPGVPAHDADHCPICQLLSTPLLRPEVTRVLPLAEQGVRPSSVAVRLPAARGPPSAHQTRAPPAFA